MCVLGGGRCVAGRVDCVCVCVCWGEGDVCSSEDEHCVWGG